MAVENPPTAFSNYTYPIAKLLTTVFLTASSVLTAFDASGAKIPGEKGHWSYVFSEMIVKFQNLQIVNNNRSHTFSWKIVIRFIFFPQMVINVQTEDLSPRISYFQPWYSLCLTKSFQSQKIVSNVLFLFQIYLYISNLEFSFPISFYVSNLIICFQWTSNFDGQHQYFEKLPKSLNGQ